MSTVRSTDTAPLPKLDAVAGLSPTPEAKAVPDAKPTPGTRSRMMRGDAVKAGPAGGARPSSLNLGGGESFGYGTRDRDYLRTDPGAGRAGRVREVQRALKEQGFFHADLTGGFYKHTQQAVKDFQAARGLPVTGRVDAATLDKLMAGKPAAKTPEARPVDGKTTGPVKGEGQTRDGLTIPRGEGKATTFANGHIPYKGWTDKDNRQNNGIGAWGDKNAPTDYFCALPVGSKQWHNQKILVTNPQNGQQVVVRVQDKGPAAHTGAAIDLSPVAMEALGGRFNGSLGRVKFEFAPADAPVGPVR